MVTVQEYLKGIEYSRDLIAAVCEKEHGTQLIFDVRGWGYLSKNCGLSEQEAVDFQDKLGEYMVTAVIEKLTRDNFCKCDNPDREAGYTYCHTCHRHVSDERMDSLIDEAENEI